MKITIVGGGTAGWIAAYFISKAQPNAHEITVIESSKLGIIGAGEGSTGTMIDLLNGNYFNAKIDLEKFLSETGGTPKLGIYHENWTGDKSGYFAPIDASPTWANFEDVIFKFALSKYGKEKMHLASPRGQDFKKRDFSSPGAVHFDGHRVGKFFKKECEKDGAVVIDDVVSTVETNTAGNVTHLTLESGKIVESDFFIDCTGFSRILMNKLDVKWHSYKEYLTVNTAMPFLINYEPGELPNPYTKATALSSGWMWEIPLAERKGCGYVFDSNFITREDAQKEIEELLGKKITPIRFINFESGRSEVFWKNNVLCLGLASTFVEPLEATSIHTTIIQLLFWVKECLHTEVDKTLTHDNILSYNQKITRLYDLTMDFISFHYQGERSDTPFWKNIKDNNIISQGAEIYKNKAKNRIPGFLEINGIVGSPAAALWNWVAAGMDIITPEQAAAELLDSNSKVSAEMAYNNNFNKKSYIKYTQ
jgi:flavin-dependent dehydrogenase